MNFLQSKEWRKFQESFSRETFSIENGDFSASVIKHQLPIVGSYFYVPRGPVLKTENKKQEAENIRELVKLAEKENTGWIRIDPENEKVLDMIKEILKKIRLKQADYRIIKAPHDMQPKEIFMVDIFGPEEELLAGMKQKTRYNIRLAEKKGVRIFISREKKHVDRFCELVSITARRDKVSAHPENYYRKMIGTTPENILKLYCAEYEGKIIATNLIVFYKDTATYLHGASDNENRNVMAPYLLQWQAILDAKKTGLKYYDFGGVKTSGGWEGITKFKFGFSLNTKPTLFPGSYDIVINKNKYFLYRILQKIKSFI